MSNSLFITTEESYIESYELFFDFSGFLFTESFQFAIIKIIVYRVWVIARRAI